MQNVNLSSLTLFYNNADDVELIMLWVYEKNFCSVIKKSFNQFDDDLVNTILVSLFVLSLQTVPVQKEVVEEPIKAEVEATTGENIENPAHTEALDDAAKQWSFLINIYIYLFHSKTNHILLYLLIATWAVCIKYQLTKERTNH